MTITKEKKSTIKVAYLVNLYPKISHTFIRREIQALESHGVEVRRYAIRSVEEPLVDAQDQEELTKTTIILNLGWAKLLRGLMSTAVAHPLRLFRTLALAVRAGIGSDRGLLRHLVYVVEACALLQILERDPVDHIHAHFATNATAVAMYCSALGGPGYSFTGHGTACFSSPVRNRLGLKLERASFAVAVCDFGRRELIRSSPSSGNKVHVIRCGIDEAFRVEPGSQQVTGHQLTAIGRLSPEKGHRVLLEAAKQLDREGLDFRLVLIGDGELRKEIENLISTLGLGERVHIAGWQDSLGVRTALGESRALVLSSFSEGLPVVIMEAMALRRPIVSTDVGGIKELVTVGETGWLAPPGDSSRLAEAMKRVLETSEQQLAEMGARGRERVLRMHDVQGEAAKLKSLFERYATQSS